MEILLFGLAFIVLVVPIWALVRTFSLKRDKATREEVAALVGRIHLLEKQAGELQQQLRSGRPAAPEAKPEPATSPRAPIAVEPPPHIVEKPPEKPTVAPPPPPPPSPPAPKPLMPPASVIPPQRPLPPPITEVPPPKPAVPAPTAKPPAPSPVKAAAPTPPKAAAPFIKQDAAAAPGVAPRRGWGDLEERVGTNWLGKIGITVLVIGLGFLLYYWIPQLGKGGKAFVAYTLSAVLLGLGVWGEKKERYRNLARVVLGGGWAATYGTTYALHHAEAMRLVESPVAGFGLLFVVAAGIVAHSLRYNSQVVTGFAYMLGFVTVVLGRMTVGTMVASALLAASLVIVLRLRKWYWLEPLGIAATYGVHWMWLRQVFGELLDRRQFAEFGTSAALVTVYWLVFTGSHFLREDREREQRLWLTTAFLMNAAGYLAVMRYQSLFPELRFWFLLGVGAAYLALAVISQRLDRRLGFLLCSTLGAALVVVAIPYRYSGARLEYIWLLEAEVLLFLGWRLADSHLRNLGWAAAGVLTPYILINDVVPRLSGVRPPDQPLGWLLLGLAVAYLANSRFVPRLLRKEATQIDEGAGTASAPVGMILLLAAAWVALPLLWVGVAWAAVALLSREYGQWMDDQVLRGCAHGAAMIAAVRLLIANAQYTPPAGAANLHLWTTALGVAVLYACAWRLRPRGKSASDVPLATQFFGEGVDAAYAWGATIPAAVLIVLVGKGSEELTWATLALAGVAAFVSYPIATGYLMTAAWLGLPYMWVALAWTALGMLLGELATWRKDDCLRACGHLAAMLAVVRLLVVNLQYAPPSSLGANLRVVTVALAVALFYIFARRIAPAKAEPESETPLAGDIVWRGGMSAVYTTAGSLIAALLIWNEVTSAAIGLAWGMLGLALVEAGRALKDEAMRWQGYTLLTLSFGRIFISDLNVVTDIGGVSARLVTVTLLAATYHYTAFSSEEKERMRAPLFWFGSIALVAMLRFELAFEWVAVSWAALTLLLFFVGRWLRLETLAHQAYALTIAIALRCAFDDFYQAETRTMTVVLASLLLYVLLGVTLLEKRRRAAPTVAAADDDKGKLGRWTAVLDEHPQHLYFFVPTMLLSVLVYLEVPRSYLTAAWGAEGVLVFIVALGLGERAFRLFSMGLLLVCVGRVVLVDVWGLNPLGRIISFMALGAALLLVSYLYTRNRESWRKYL